MPLTTSHRHLQTSQQGDENRVTYYLSFLILKNQKASKQWRLIFKMHLEYNIEKNTQICRNFEGADLSCDYLSL